MAYLEPVWVSFFHHSISVTQFLSLITHNSSLNTHFFTFIWQHYFYFHHSIFSHYSWVPHLSTGTIFFFFSTQLTEANIKKKLKKKHRTVNPGKEKKKKTERPTQEKKKSQRQPKKKKKMSKGGQKLQLWVSYVCLNTILPLSYELWKLKIAKSCFQFP